VIYFIRATPLSFMTHASFSIKVPCSTSNLGPGFDVLGMALNMHLIVDVVFGSNKAIILAHKGQGEGLVPLDGTNLLLSSATFLANKVAKLLPANMSITVHNSIPLGGGLGSSGAAIVAGVLLASHVLNLRLSREVLLAVCVEIEGHPDNVTPALVGGCVACCGKEKIDNPSDSVPFPPRSYFLPVPFDRSIRCVAVSPAYHVSTAKARAALPEKYPKKDVIFNLQRVAILVAGLGSKQNKQKLNEAMKDTVHQPYRAKLVPGLEQILGLNNDPELKQYGLIGITLSGSGPTILALTDAEEDAKALAIGAKIENIFQHHQLKSTVRLLSVDTEGAVVTVATTKSRL